MSSDRPIKNLGLVYSCHFLLNNKHTSCSIMYNHNTTTVTYTVQEPNVGLRCPTTRSQNLSHAVRLNNINCD